ncbi:MAG TPA: alginate lyase family protein [Caldilineaceae bacterium]|nr:alginate lyase family protein [Caldilineaceae bacterium]
MVQNTENHPELLLWSAACLTNAKQQLAQAVAPLQPAYQKLLRDAEQALAVGPFSVLDKPMVAPSGDKHDYYSIGPYWWPNPETSDGLPYIRRDGEVNPERERYDASARSQMESAVITLALAWYFTGDERYASHATHLLRTWFLDPATRMNPHLAYGQAIPGICDGRGIGIIETHNFPTLLDAVALLRTSPHWREEDQRGFSQWFRAYLDWLLTSKHGRDEAVERNNHGTWYDVQVAAFAIFVGDQQAARRALSENTPERIITQIEPDGSQPHELARTRSLSYSVMNLLGLMDAADLGQQVGVDLWHFVTGDGRGIRRAVDYLLHHALEQPWPNQQITPATSIVLLPVLYRAAIAYGEPAYLDQMAFLPAEHTRQRSHLLYGGAQYQ